MSEFLKRIAESIIKDGCGKYGENYKIDEIINEAKQEFPNCRECEFNENVHGYRICSRNLHEEPQVNVYVDIESICPKNQWFIKWLCKTEKLK